MKVLVEIKTTNWLTYRFLCLEIKKKYPEVRFVAILTGEKIDTKLEDTLKQELEISFESIINFSTIYDEAFTNEEIDYTLIKNFESQCDEKSIWRLIAKERNIGHVYIHGHYGPKMQSQGYLGHKKCLAVTSHLLKNVIKLFDTYEPDLVIPAIAQCSMIYLLVDELSRQRKIQLVCPTTLRINNLFSYATNSLCNFPEIAKLYEKIQAGEVDLNKTQGENVYNDIISNIVTPQYFERNYDWFTQKTISGFTPIIKLFFSLIKSLAAVSYNFIIRQTPRIKNDPRTQMPGLKTYFRNLKYAILKKVQKFRINRLGYTYVPVKGEKYVYYPLHLTPEYSTQVMGTMWINQLNTIELLSKSIPADWVIYVKEHPATFMARARPYDFYNQIKSYPNVKLINLEISMNELISNAQLVAVVTGTSGWEAIQRGIPVLTFAANFFDCLGLSFKCLSMDQLSIDIITNCNKLNAISPEIRKERMCSFFTACLELGFDSNYPTILTADETGTDEIYQAAAAEASLGLFRFLEKVKFYDLTVVKGK